MTDIDKEMYYADGRQIRMKPIRTENKDGSFNSTVGFPVCVVEEYVEDPEQAAKWIAEAMNNQPALK